LLFCAILACIAIAFIVEYWVYILLVLLVMIGVYTFCVNKKLINYPMHYKRLKKTLNIYPTPTKEHYLAYQYEDVKFYPIPEMVERGTPKNLYPGAEIQFKQEPDNENDNRAVALYISGKQIGYMLRGTLQDMCNDYIENRWPIKATLSSLEKNGGEYYGYVNLQFYRESKFQGDSTGKRLGYSDIDIKSIQPSTPDIAGGTPLAGKNIVFSGTFKRPLDEMMQIAVDAGAVLKTRVSKSTNYLVAGKQKEEFLDEDGLSSKEATAQKLIAQGCPIVVIDEQTFLTMANTLDF
jgi:hypothetical protein